MSRSSRGGSATNSTSASGLIGLWNSRVVMAPVLGATMNLTPSSSTKTTRTTNVGNNEGGSSYLKLEAGKKPRSSFTKFRQLEKQAASVMAQSSSPSSSSNPSSPKTTTTNNNNNTTPSNSNSTEKKMFVSRSASSAKEVILSWVKETIQDYDSINVTNFSSSWSDGLAFCALIHNFYPEAFDFASLKSENRRHNFEVAFSAAEEYAGIYPLLEVDDMVKMKTPDWKCVFTYVQSFYRRFRNGRDPPTPNKSLILNSSSSSPDAPRHR